MAIKVNQEGVSHCLHLAQTGRINHGKWNEAGIARNAKNKEKFLAVDDDFKPDSPQYWKYPVVGNDGLLNRKALGSAQGYAEKNGETEVVAACKKIAEVADKTPDHRSNDDNCDLERRYLAPQQCEIRMTTEKNEAGGDDLVCRGYAAIHDSFSDVLTTDKGEKFREVIRPGAFTRSLGSNPDCRLMVNHDGLPLARTLANTLSLTGDSRGLAFRAVLDPTDPDVTRVTKKLSRKGPGAERCNLDSMSFGFRTPQGGDAWLSPGEDGLPVRELRDIDLHDGDISIVTYPAYKATYVGVRAAESFQEYRSRVQQAAKAKYRGISPEQARRIIALSEL